MGRDAATDDELAELFGDAPAKPAIGSREYARYVAAKVPTGPTRLGLPATTSISKKSQERMLLICKYMCDIPITAEACRNAGISITCLKNWLSKSNDGVPGDGFDLIVDDTMPPEEREFVRFHEAYDNAMQWGLGRVEGAAFKLAMPHEEVLTYQGRVIYREDPQLVIEGKVGPAAWLRDDNGNPIPESIMKQDPDMLMFVLKARMPHVYGSKQIHDHTIRGGVLVVAAKAVTSEEVSVLEKKYRDQAIDVEFDEVGDD